MIRQIPPPVYFIVAGALFLSSLVWLFFLGQIRSEREEAIHQQARHNANLVAIFADHGQSVVANVDSLLLEMRQAHLQPEGKSGPREVPTPSGLARTIVSRAIFDEFGVVVEGPPKPEETSITERAYFTAQKSSQTDELVVGKAVVGVSTGRLTVHISRRITKADGGFGGVVMVGVDPTVFTQLYQKVEMGRSGYVSFVGYDGQTRAQRRGSVVTYGGDVSQNINFRKMIDERAQNPQGSMIIKSAVDGVERVFSFMTLPALSMVAVVGTGKDEAIAAAVKRASYYVGIAAAATAAFLVLATLLSMDLFRQRRHRWQIRQLNAGLEQRIAARSTELKEANQRLAAFSYSVSHDLRGPLTTIDGFSGLLQRRKSLQTDEPSLALITRIRKGVLQMKLLIDGLLSLATLPQKEINRECINLTELARALAAQQAQAAPSRAVEVWVENNLQVQADRRMMSSVMSHLLSNAWKFTADTPAARVEVGSRQDGNGDLSFFVRDNGAGFDMTKAEKLFQTFARLHSSTQFEGAGLGLATVKHIITMHGGQVWAEGASGAGATFYFRLPGAAPQGGS